MSYDAIVVGARCAGAPTAMLLARKGYKVLLLDRAPRGSDVMSGHYIHPAGLARLQRWGLLERAKALGAPTLRTTRFDVGPFALEGTPPPVDGVSDGLCARRGTFDDMLVGAAIEAGAEFRDRFVVTGVLRDGDRVDGVRGSIAGGTSLTARARLVVGADGTHSTIAKLVGAETHDEVETLTCGYMGYFANLPSHGTELYVRDGGFLVATPTNDGITLVASLWPRAAFPRVRRDVETEFEKALASAPDLAARVARASRIERFRGTADLPNFFRRSQGKGWALAGDAGYHKDPITAQGMTDAFRSADLLADAADGGLSGRRSLGEALADYERRRDEEAMPMYRLTCDLARLAAPDEPMREILEALRWNDAQRARFLGVMAGSVPVGEFFSPANLEGIRAAHRTRAPRAA